MSTKRVAARRRSIIRGLFGGFLLGILVPAAGAVVGTVIAAVI